MAQVVTGWGVMMIGITTWGRAANLRKAGLTVPGAKLSAYRAQYGSKATRWEQVAQEARELVAVHTMARLLGASSGIVTDGDVCHIVGWPARVASELKTD